jgi:iron complex transport system ATP-binding protein
MGSGVIVNIRDLCVSYSRREVLKNISLSVKTDERWAIIGKNGTGKSTLIKAIGSLLPITQGTIDIDDLNITRYDARSRALKISYVPQKLEGVIPYSVYDYIMLGRYASMGLLAVPSKKDCEVVEEAAALCDVSHLCSRIMSTLSGGELQRVLLAGAVAQQTPLMLLDEPTAFLDPAHERLFFHALARVHDYRDLTIMMVTHDINAALTYCTHVCGLLNGTIAFSGTIDTFKNECPGILQKLYEIPFVKYSSPDNDNHVYGAWGVQC